MKTKNKMIRESWDEFIKLAKHRLEQMDRMHSKNCLSEQTFQLDFALSLSKTEISSLDVFCEYPCMKNPSQKLDIFVDKDNGYCFEMKFFRPIPSRKNPPFTQHYGAFLADVLKLVLTCSRKNNRYLIVIADNKFNNYFRKKNLLRNETDKKYRYDLNLKSLPSTAVKEIKKRLKHIDIPEQTTQITRTVAYTNIDNYFFYLLQIIMP